MAAETLGRVQINLSAQHDRQRVLQLDEFEEPHSRLRLELDQHIHVAVRAEVVAQGRAEQRQLANVVALAEGGEVGGGNGEMDGHTSFN